MADKDLPSIADCMKEDSVDPRARDWIDKWNPEDPSWKEWVVDLASAYEKSGMPLSRAWRRCQSVIPGFPEVGFKAFCDGIRKRQ